MTITCLKVCFISTFEISKDKKHFFCSLPNDCNILTLSLSNCFPSSSSLHWHDLQCLHLLPSPLPSTPLQPGFLQVPTMLWEWTCLRAFAFALLKCSSGCLIPWRSLFKTTISSCPSLNTKVELYLAVCKDLFILFIPVGPCRLEDAWGSGSTFVLFTSLSPASIMVLSM